jgi:TRAP-type C4-dicarboxylate transport system substrate-binding protein
MDHLSRRALLLGTASLPLVTPFIGKAVAQTRWQLATPYPDGNFHTRNLRDFITEVQSAASGLQIQMHSNASLLKMPEIKRGVQTGQAQLGEILLSAYGNEDPFFELQRPYVEARLQRQGITLLYMVPWPQSGFYTNVPVESVETLRGMKMRTFNALTNRFATLAGATPTLVQQAEVPQAFATGVVNAMVTSAATGVDVQAWDFCKFFTPIGFTRTKNAVFVQTRALQALPEASQRAIRAAAAAAEARGWQASEVETVERQNMLASRGMTIGTPSPALMQGLARIGATQADEWVAKAGEEGKRLMDAYRAAIA